MRSESCLTHSLLEQNDHVVVNIEADVAVGLILHREAATKDDQAVPRLPKLVIELSLHVLGDVRVIRRPEALQALDHRNHSGLRHLRIHIVSLNPNFAIRGAAVDLEGVAVVTGDNDGFSAVGPSHAVSLHLSGHDFHHFLKSLTFSLNQ